MASSDLSDDRYGLKQPINVNDFAKAIQKPISANEKPYTASARKVDNAEIDEFVSTVLSQFQDSKKQVVVKDAWFYFEIFRERREIERMQAIKSHLPRPTDAQLRHIITTLKNSTVEELKGLGNFAVAYAWDVLTKEIKMRSSEEKWKTVYSTTTDFKKLVKLVESNIQLFTGGTSLIEGLSNNNLNDIAEKVKATQEVIRP